MTAEPNRKKKGSSSFLARTQPMKNHGLRFLKPSQLPLPPYKSVLRPLPCRGLHISRHGCRLQTVILCWSQINSHLLEKYLAVYLFQVNILVALTGTREDPRRLQGWWANKCFTYKLSSLGSLLFSPALEFEGTSFSWIQDHTLHLKLSRFYSGSA